MSSVVDRGRMLAGRYRLDELVGSGGAGQVWRAVDLVLERPVAVKLLWPDAAGDPVARARFRAEARHASCLSHPRVAQVHDYGECGPDDTPFLVLELVDGSSLAGVLAAGPLDPADTIDVIAQVAAGLQAAHSAGLVHRDIKPANLLVGRDGQVKITDFGLASVTGSASLTTSGGLVVGTAAYLAPERAAGEPATAASDLYSLGVVGYHCLTGRPPFCGPPAEVAVAHLHYPFPPLPGTVPAGLRELVAALMAKEPADRPGSAGEVCRRAEILRAAPTAGAGPLCGGSPPALSGPRTADPAPTLAQASSAALQEDGQPPIRTPAGAARHRMRWVLIAAGLAIAAALVAAGAARWKTPVTGARPHTVVRPNPPASHPAPAVAVNAASLTGKPVGFVLAELRRLGLRPDLVWVPSSAQPPGTVLQVQPAGTLPRGTTVTVTAAAQPPQPSDRHGGGNSNGGHGKGNNGNNSADGS
jgi:eukaryotic-like serine/threonine-protein kinase